MANIDTMTPLDLMQAPIHTPVVALTGGFCSGKSTAARYFAQLEVPIVDADVISHSLTKTGAPLLKTLRASFGETFFDKTGTLKRAKLRDHVFAHPSELLKLEAILHPPIFATVLNELTKARAPYQLLVVPLLFESAQYAKLYRLSVVVDCPPEQQFSRASARTDASPATLKAIFSSQLPRSTRLKLANHVLDNSGDLSHLERTVSALHQELLVTMVV